MISLGMMVVMFGGMIVVTSKAAKKNIEEERKKQDKVNPYKEAKKTGKSVEEIVEKDQKRKAKEKRWFQKLKSRLQCRMKQKRLSGCRILLPDRK